MLTEFFPKFLLGLVPFLVHLETIEKSGVEPSILWAICSKAVKIENNWVSEPLCHVKSQCCSLWHDGEKVKPHSLM